MKNPKIAEVLKKYRKHRNLTVPQVTEILKEHGYDVAVKTIYGWESGATQPTADTLMLLCELYEIEDILATFGYEGDPNKTFSLTRTEKELIRNFRAHPDMQAAVFKLLDVEDTSINYQNKSEQIFQEQRTSAAEDSGWSNHS